MKFLGCYLTIATALAKMKIVTWVIPYAGDGSNTSAGAVDEVLTLSFSCGTGDTLTSPPGFGTKSKPGFVPRARVLSGSVLGSGGFIPWLCWVTHGTAGNRLCPGKEQAEPGPPSLVSSSQQHRSWIPTWNWSLGCWRWGAVGCKGEPGCVGLPRRRRRCHPSGQKARRHLGWQDLRTKEVAAKAREEKWLESVKAVDRGGRGWVAGRGEACFKMTGTIWFMLTHSTSQFGRSANKLGQLMQALLRETWKNG